MEGNAMLQQHHFYNSNSYHKCNYSRFIICHHQPGKIYMINQIGNSVCIELTHWGRDKMASISQTIFLNVFSWLKMYEFRLRFDWSLFLRLQLTLIQHWFRKWLGVDKATSHHLNQWWLFFRRKYASHALNELTHRITHWYQNNDWHVVLRRHYEMHFRDRI